jgi:hypothetical protein
MSWLPAAVPVVKTATCRPLLPSGADKSWNEFRLFIYHFPLSFNYSFFSPLLLSCYLPLPPLLDPYISMAASKYSLESHLLILLSKWKGLSYYINGPFISDSVIRDKSLFLPIGSEGFKIRIFSSRDQTKSLRKAIWHFSFLWLYSPWRTLAVSHIVGFFNYLHIWQDSLDEWSARRKASTYTGQHNTERRGQTSMP